MAEDISSSVSGGNYTLTSSDALGCSAQAHVSISGPPGADSIFGNNVWKVNAYAEGNQSDYGYSWLPQDYSGYYIDSSLNFNSQNKWDENSNPSMASGYQGCSIYDDYMSWSAKEARIPLWRLPDRCVESRRRRGIVCEWSNGLEP